MPSINLYSKSVLTLTPHKSLTFGHKLESPPPKRMSLLTPQVNHVLSSAADTYKEEDSQIMSERGDNERKETIHREAISAKKIVKPTISSIK